jgi:phage terminase large subunit-like protein
VKTVVALWFQQQPRKFFAEGVNGMHASTPIRTVFIGL